MCGGSSPSPAPPPAPAPAPPRDGPSAPEFNEKTASERNSLAAAKRGRRGLKINLVSTPDTGLAGGSGLNPGGPA
jgi:hypothetical protein